MTGTHLLASDWIGLIAIVAGLGALIALAYRGWSVLLVGPAAALIAAAIAEKLTRLLGIRHAIFAVVASCALLTYGGISLFVVAFVVVPVAAPGLGLIASAIMFWWCCRGSIPTSSPTPG